MKKEAIFAIIIGVLVGLGITFGIYQLRLKTSRTNTTNSDITSDTTSTPTPTDNSNQKLLITSPIDESIVSSTDLRVSGTAEPNEMVVILINDKEYVTQADSIGAFAQDVELDNGGNIVTVIAVAADGTQTKVVYNVVVSSASLDEKVETSPAEDTASASATPKVTTKPTSVPKTTAKPTQSENP